MYSRVLPATSMLARPLASPAGLPQPGLGAGSIVPPPPVTPGPGVSLVPSARVTLPKPSAVDAPDASDVPAVAPVERPSPAVRAASVGGVLPGAAAGAAGAPPTTGGEASELPQEAASESVANAIRSKP